MHTGERVGALVIAVSTETSHTQVHRGRSRASNTNYFCLITTPPHCNPRPSADTADERGRHTRAAPSFNYL